LRQNILTTKYEEEKKEVNTRIKTTYKPLLVFDFLHKEFSTEKEFEKLVENYPDHCVVLVSPEAKRKISGFAANSTRYIEATDAPLYTDRNALVYDTIIGTVIVMTGRDLDKVGNTYRDKEDEKVQSYVSMGMKVTLESLAKFIGNGKT